MIDLDAIRARDERFPLLPSYFPTAMHDRRALLAYVDALREVAWRVCEVYAGQIQNDGRYGAIDDLRTKLQESTNG